MNYYMKMLILLYTHLLFINRRSMDYYVSTVGSKYSRYSRCGNHRFRRKIFSETNIFQLGMWNRSSIPNYSRYTFDIYIMYDNCILILSWLLLTIDKNVKFR